MSEKDLKTHSGTDWARIDQLKDEDIDTSDIPPLDDSFFDRAQLRVPSHKTAVTLAVDDEVLRWFEAQGAEFQHRMNAALRIYAEAHRD